MYLFAAIISYIFSTYFELSFFQSILLFLSFIPFKRIFELTEYQKIQHAYVDNEFSDEKMLKHLELMEKMDEKDFFEHDITKKVLRWFYISSIHKTFIGISIASTFWFPPAIISGIVNALFFIKKKENKFVLCFINTISFIITILTIFSI